MTWKQFWCKHFWKQEEMELIRKETLRNIDTGQVLHYNVYAVNYICIKCNKFKLNEERKFVG
jgi:hypothetical protein